MEKIDIRDMHKLKAKKRALELFEKLQPNESLVVISEDNPKIVYDAIKRREDFDKESYEITEKEKNKYISEFLKK